jgi:nitroreductase/dihydropteridine reductase
MDIIESLNWRYAVKSFNPDKKLTAEQVERIKDGLQLTPTSMGLQLMQFVIIENQDLKNQIVPFAYNQKQVADCSHLLILCRKTHVQEDDITTFLGRTGEVRDLDDQHPTLQSYEKMLRNSLNLSMEQQQAWMENQVYIALGNLLTVCAAEKIDSCPMEGFNRTQLDEFLGLPEKNLTAVVMCPIGYRSDEDKYSQVNKVRRLKEDLFTEIK